MRSNRGIGPALFGAPLLLFLVLPPLALLIRGRESFVQSIRSPESTEAIWVSLRTTFASLALLVLFGTPLALWLSSGKRFLTRPAELLIDLPLVLPPAAAGIGLLLALGRNGMIPTGMPFTAGAVIAAQSFVSAPLYVRAATAAFSSVPGEIVEMAALEGAGRWRSWTKVIAPISFPILLSGAAMAWARGLGEFGATILFAGNMPGRTQTLPLAIYIGFETNIEQATGMSVLLLVVAAVVLVLARALPGADYGKS